MPPKRVKLDKGDDEYKKRRDRNNVAVRKSREKAKQKQMETNEKVKQLREENEQLEQKVVLLNKELSVLKDLFLSQAWTEQGSVENAIKQEESKSSSRSTLENFIKHNDSDNNSCDLQPQTPVNTHALWKDHEYSVSMNESNQS